MPDIIYRSFTAQDFEGCARLAAQAWPVRPHISEGPEPWRIMEPYIDIASGWSNWKEVACDSQGNLVGLMFGEIRGRDAKGRKRTGMGWSVLSSEAKVHAKFVLGRYGTVRNMPGILRNFSITELKLIINRPEADAEVNLFLVDEKRRGKGVGTELLGRFVETARAQGATRISVYADDQASNWAFYERYGFERTGTFYDNWSSYYNRKESHGIRLALDLERRPGPPSAP